LRTKPRWDKFEWDDENKKNGNIQHLRDHSIEPQEAEECFFHDYVFARDERRYDEIYVLGRKDRPGAEGCDWFFKIRAMA
jgi:uncharacterized DUF497 family protein